MVQFSHGSLQLLFLALSATAQLDDDFKHMYPFANITQEMVVPLPETLIDQMITMPRDCAEVLDQTPSAPSGVYTIYPSTCPGSRCYFNVYCDMLTDGGGWTVIQRRCDGTTDFYRGWYFYRMGFGNVNNEYYLGNERIHWLTTQRPYELQVWFTDVGGQNSSAGYSHFYIDDEASNYRLHIDSYYGDAGDYFSSSNSMQFSTFDRDNDGSHKNCAAYYHSAWWYGGYNDCKSSTNLNGYYFLGRSELPQFAGPGLSWRPVPGPGGPALQKVVMKIRPMGFLGGSRLLYPLPLITPIA